MNGRARKNLADIDYEMMPLASQEVCRLWNGKAIVRSKGDLQIKQIVYIPISNNNISPESFVKMDPCT